MAKKPGIYEEYFTLSDKYRNDFGDKTVLLMQVGAFFEVYGLGQEINDENEIKRKYCGPFTGSHIQEFITHCDLNISNKHAEYKNKYVYMAGFRDYSLERYLKKLDDVGYTTVVYIQSPEDKQVRILHNIYSPGTYFSSEDNQKISNTTTAIWLDKIRNPILKNRDANIFVGVASIDIYTGKTHIYEYMVENMHNHTSYDELERLISTYNPSETIIIYNSKNFTEANIDDIIEYSSIKAQTIHRIDISDSNVTYFVKTAKQMEKQKYQMKLLSEMYDDKSDGIFHDLQEYSIACCAFCFLIDFVGQHNADLVKRITEPLFDNTSERMTLANHTLQQLNIIDDHKITGKKSSVMSLLNECVTIMGKRAFNHNMANPTSNVETLEREYNIIEYCKETKFFDYLRNVLTNIKDFEKNNRKLVLRKIAPADLNYLYDNMDSVGEIYSYIDEKERTVFDYMKQHIDFNILDVTADIRVYMDKFLDIDKCEFVDNNNFEVNIFNRGIYDDLDNITESLEDAEKQLSAIRTYLNNKMISHENKGKIKDFINVHETEKGGISLTATKKRCDTLKKILGKNQVELSYVNTITNKETTFQFTYHSIEFVTQTSNSKSIETPIIKEACRNITRYRTQLKKELESVYQKFICEFQEKYGDSIHIIVKYCTILDMIQSKSFVAHKFNYCKPEISKLENDDDESCEQSYMSIRGLRHPLIEHIQNKEIYVPNDVDIGCEEQNGILIYGTNAVGKSSLIRSIGISAILAQAGMFVPCSEFIYYPYKSIFTRILGNDNIFKGLSTFAVEMTELRTILQMADENSLILGDELCSGTESDSAISIFVAGLMKLHERNCSFIFATHFHEIANMEEITSLDSLKLKHMRVIYNKETGALEYNRKLQDGPGDSMYGLEVCKSLHLPDDFLKMAYEIREKRKPFNKAVSNYDASHFNQKKLVGNCEICKKAPATEVHHLQHQKHADENGFIGEFHKNHEANLVGVCNDCHLNFHKTDTQHRKVKTTNGMVVQEI